MSSGSAFASARNGKPFRYSAKHPSPRRCAARGSGRGSDQLLVLTLGDDPQSLRQAHQRGAAAYVLKGEPVSHLLSVIEQLESSRYHFAAPALPQNRFDLTQRELDVNQILQTGWSAKEMGSHLFLSEATVKTHLASIYRKLEDKNRTQAIVVALANHLIAE